MTEEIFKILRECIAANRAISSGPLATMVWEALDLAGYTVAPKESTPEMCSAFYSLCKKEGTLAVSASDAYRAMISAST